MRPDRIRLRIDGREVEVARGATLLEAARAAGAEVPSLCAREGGTSASCMICLVGLGGRFVPSCAIKVRPEMEIDTASPAVSAARRAAAEILLAEHAGDCEAPCRRACPAHFDAPAFFRALALGDSARATEIAGALVLPGALGRVCPAPCIKACRANALGRPLGIRSAHAAFPAGPASATGSGPVIAIVGAGPAGLAAAVLLGRVCRVLVIEREADPGGGLRGADPDPRSLSAEISALGLRIETGRTLDAAGFAALRESHPAVLLAIGSPPPADWGVGPAGRDGATALPGVFVAGEAHRPMHRASVRAIAAGREAAERILAHLDRRPLAARRRFHSSLGTVTHTEAEALAAAAEPALDANGTRCLRCDCRAAESCRLREAATRLGISAHRFGRRTARVASERDGPVLFEVGKCIRCGACIAATERAGGGIGLGWSGRGAQMRPSPPAGRTWSEAIAGADLRGVCPTGALTLGPGENRS